MSSGLNPGLFNGLLLRYVCGRKWERDTERESVNHIHIFFSFPRKLLQYGTVLHKCVHVCVFYVYI